MTDSPLTRADFNHLEFALGEIRRTGTYYGQRGHFIRRQERLERWVAQQRLSAPRKEPK